jgi:hypothetical protein
VIGENRTLAIGGLPFSEDKILRAGMKGVHGDHQTADRPEHAIFDAANYPNPAFGHLIGRGGSDQQMDEGDECDILQVDAEKKADTEERLMAPSPIGL